MGISPVLAAFDFAGGVGFLIAVGIGLSNYRKAGVERPFWLVFVLTAGLGACWLGFVGFEWLGVSSATLDQFSTTLQAVVLGLYSLGVVVMWPLVDDLQRSRIETTRRESLVAVLSRVLRHNIRNDMTVIRGHTKSKGEASTVVRETIDGLIEKSEKARKLEQSLSMDDTARMVSLDALVREVVDTVGADYPEATITLESPGDCGASIPVSIQPGIAELVQNAARHSGRSPSVEVIVDTDSEVPVVHVVDDGPGLPLHERELLGSAVETPLVHGSGIGLWIAEWIITAHGGEIDCSVDADGTRLTVSFPRKASERHWGTDNDTITTGFDRYHAIFENGTDAHLVIDDGGRIVDANDQAAGALDRVRTALLGQSIRDVYPDNDAVEKLLDSFGASKVASGKIDLPEGTSVSYVAVPDVVLGEHLLTMRTVDANGSEGPTSVGESH